MQYSRPKMTEEFLHASIPVVVRLFEGSSHQEYSTRQAVVDTLTNEWVPGVVTEKGWNDFEDSLPGKELIIGTIIQGTTEMGFLVPKRVRDARLVGTNVLTSSDEIQTELGLMQSFRKNAPDTLENVRAYWTIREMARQKYLEIMRKNEGKGTKKVQAELNKQGVQVVNRSGRIIYWSEGRLSDDSCPFPEQLITFARNKDYQQPKSASLLESIALKIQQLGGLSFT